MAHSREKGFQTALEKACQDLRKLEPYKTAYMAGCNFHAEDEGGQFLVRFFGEEYTVTFPDISVRNASGEEADITTRLIILHYLIHADGTFPADRWITFRELPDGLIYDQAFQKRANLRLLQAYGSDPKGFAAAAKALGGERLSFGDAAYMFRLLPRIRMAVILHLGDEELAPAVNVLFDAAAGHYLPIEDLAVLGGMLASKLIKAGSF
ncbi:MAG: DUF3786 domain-containing protein [Chloroflexi bacterium]|nr:DUF3786 domain-containing protein [Chloroflexota bacterium]